MAARKGTVLSDEHILKECAHYRPIPMKLAAKILDEDNVSAKKSPFTSKPLKYIAQLSRPAHFDAYAHSLSRNLGNDPEFRARLHTAYNDDIAQHHHDQVRPDIEMDEADPHLAMMYMNRLFDLFEANNIPVPPAANDAPGENVAPPAQPDLPNNIDFGGGYDFGADPEPEEEEEVPPLQDEDEDEGPPPLEGIPPEEENAPAPEANYPEASENAPEPNQDYSQYYLMGVEKYLPPTYGEKPAKKMKERETQFLPKPLPKANVSGMKLRSGTQLQGPSQKRQQGLGPNDAQFPTTQLRPLSDPFNIGAKDPLDTPVPVRTSDIESQKIRKALFNLEQQRLASQKRHSGYGAGTSASHGAYFL